MDSSQILQKLLQFDTPCVTNVVATYPKSEFCLGLFHPWTEHWYTDETLHCMFPELGRRVGYAVTVTYGLPDPNFTRLGFVDVCRAIELSPKPVILVVKQDLPPEIKKKNGLLGGCMMSAFKALGTVGVISDGPSRDLDEVRRLDMQYMLTGACAGHGYFAVRAVNTPVDVCGMAVAPGEIIHMDENGAVKFPASQAERVVELCGRLSALEEKKQQDLLACRDAETMAKIMSKIYK